ncbi:MAG: amidase [Anaerolineaceae bacterium]|nr:amidase [Anaerolineaceae bacterium]
MTSYNLKSLKLPKLTGNMLSIFANLVETRFGQALLLNSLLENGGIPKLRTLIVDEAPTFYPLVRPDSDNSSPVDMTEPTQRDWPSPYPSSLDYSMKYQQGEISPVDVVDQILRNIKSSEQGEKPMRVFIAVDRDNLSKQAQDAADRIKAGKRISPLDGVPVAIKDEIDMLPYPTTVGTAFLGKQPANEDSTVVARLRAAGALLVGKTNMHEIGIAPNGMNVHHGTVRNPFDLNYDTGGSSSGSAAAVAAGLVPVAMGADGGGSIRIPASLCGVVGLKSTFGRVSEFGAAPLCWSVAHLGPLAASVYDAALTYSIIAGPDPKDPNTLTQPPVTVQGWNTPDLEGVRLGVYPEWNEHADKDVVSVFKEMLTAFVKRGATLIEIEIPELDEIRIAHAITILSEMAMCMRVYKSQRKEMAEAVRLSLVLGEVMTSSDYLRAQRYRTRAISAFDTIFQNVDVILTPGTAKTAQPFPISDPSAGWSDLSIDTEYMRYVYAANLTGLPAISFPAGYDTRGLPVGIQAISRHWQENMLFRVAFNAEMIMERRTPANFYPSLIL